MPAHAQGPRVVLFEDPALSAARLHYPLLITEGRGYRIRCVSQNDEEAVIRGFLAFGVVFRRVGENVRRAGDGFNFHGRDIVGLEAMLSNQPEGSRYRGMRECFSRMGLHAATGDLELGPEAVEHL